MLQVTPRNLLFGKNIYGKEEKEKEKEKDAKEEGGRSYKKEDKVDNE